MPNPPPIEQRYGRPPSGNGNGGYLNVDLDRTRLTWKTTVSLVVAAGVAVGMWLGAESQITTLGRKNIETNNRIGALEKSMRQQFKALSDQITAGQRKVVGRTKAGVHSDTLEEYCWAIGRANPGLERWNCPDPLQMPSSKFRGATR